LEDFLKLVLYNNRIKYLLYCRHRQSLLKIQLFSYRCYRTLVKKGRATYTSYASS